MKKLMIVFPVYKSHHMLDRAFQALRDQSFKDFSVVLLNDASLDSFDTLIARYRQFFDISIDRNEKNLGAKGNMWKSLHYPTDSEYLLSHHDDDFFKTDYLERAITLLDADKDISFAVTGPEWVHADVPYVNKKMDTDMYNTFTASALVYNLLHFAPYMFSSVIYRTKHAQAVTDWSYPRMHGYFDRHYLGLILDTHKSKGVYLHGNGIIEHDHSLDEYDNRGDADTVDDAINLLTFYKSLLQKEYPKSVANKLITNQTLFFFRNFSKKTRGTFADFYKKQKPHHLIHPLSIHTLGIFSLLTLSISQETKKKLLTFIRKIKP